MSGRVPAQLPVVLFLAACGLSAPAYRGPPSAHFDGHRFHNVPATQNPGFRELLRWRRTRDHADWGRPRDTPPGPRPPTRVTGEVLRVTWIGHATTLIQTAGLNILTDPVWAERVGPFPSLSGPRRHRPPGVRFEELPPIDVVLISHNHYDHLDLATLRRLAKAHHPRILAGLGTRGLLRREGIAGGEDLDWWQGVPVGPNVTIHAVPVQHSSRRGIDDTDVELWAGYVIAAPGGAVYFAGDTGFGPHFAAARARFGPPRLALLPIGANRPRWFMKPLHMNPAEALQAHRALEARRSIAIHFGTFDLADEGELEPAADLRAAGAGDDFWVLEIGEGREVP